MSTPTNQTTQKPIIAIDVTLIVHGEFGGITNVTKKVHEAFHNDSRFQTINAFFDHTSQKYYAIRCINR